MKKYFRRTPWERTTMGLIGLGLFMLMQPWSIDVYSYAFTVLLAIYGLRRRPLAATPLA